MRGKKKQRAENMIVFENKNKKGINNKFKLLGN